MDWDKFEDYGHLFVLLVMCFTIISFACGWAQL